MLRSPSLAIILATGCTQPVETVDALVEPPQAVYDQACASGTQYPLSLEQGCPGGDIADVVYYYPLRDNAELLDISYQDSPMGDLPETYPAGVRYDFNRDATEMSYCTGIHSLDGARDYMGNNTSYNRHNGYDNVIGPARTVIEGGGLVYPMAPGFVTRVTTTEGWETTIDIQHANGFHSSYTHMLAGSNRVRETDHVDRTTPIAQVFGAKETESGAPNERLHYSFHDCHGQDEPSLYEVFRADRHLMALKPLYDSGPSDASDIVITLNGVADVQRHDSFRFRRGETVHLLGTGQWRTSDQIAVELLDPNGVTHGTTTTANSSLGRAGGFEVPSSYTIGPSDPLGYWRARVVVNGTVRFVKWIFVTPAGSTPNANGLVQSAASIVSSGTDHVRAYYRTATGALSSFRWRARSGWDYTTHSGPALAAAPSCVQRDASLVDCFYRGTDGHLRRWASTDGGNNGAVTDIYALPGAGDPMAFSTGPASLEIAFADNGTLSFLHFDGSAFPKTATSSEAVAQAPSCVVEDATHWRCYAKAPSGALREISVVGGVVGAGITAPTGSQWADVQALRTPQPLDQKDQVIIVDQAGGAMRHRTEVHYLDTTQRWPTYWDGTIGAAELSTPPRCAMRPGSRVSECFAADLDHNLVHTTWTGTRWLPWAPILLTAMDRQAPAIAAVNGDRLDAFYAATPNTQSALVQRTQNSNLWYPEQSLASADMGFAPSCEARGGEIDCFTVSSTGAVSRRIFDGTAWTVHAPFASGAASSVSAVALSSVSESMMFIDATGSLIERALTDTTWTGLPVVVGKPTGTSLVDAPGCTLRRTFHYPTPASAIDCFARTADNRLATISKSGSTWGAWSFVPNAQPASSPSAVSTTLFSGDDVFYRGADNVLVQVTGSGTVWSDPIILGGSIASAPACVSRVSPVRIDCIAQGFRSLPQDLAHYSYQATMGWTLPHALGTGLANLALHKAAQQSSEYTPSPAPASRAVDGTIDGNFNNGSVTHTSNTSASWWRVDLGAILPIDHIQVFNRTDAAQLRLAGFTIKVSNDGVSWQTPQGPAIDFQRTSPIPFPGTYMPVKRAARYVMVQLPAPEYLHLAEVMVMGREQ